MGGVSVNESTIGVLPRTVTSALSGSSYQYGSKTIGGKKSKKSAKKSKKSAKKSRKSRKTSKKWFPMLGF